MCKLILDIRTVLLKNVSLISSKRATDKTGIAVMSFYIVAKKEKNKCVADYFCSDLQFSYCRLKTDLICNYRFIPLTQNPVV